MAIPQACMAGIGPASFSMSGARPTGQAENNPCGLLLLNPWSMAQCRVIQMMHTCKSWLNGSTFLQSNAHGLAMIREDPGNTHAVIIQALVIVASWPEPLQLQMRTLWKSLMVSNSSLQHTISKKFHLAPEEALWVQLKMCKLNAMPHSSQLCTAKGWL